MSILALMKLRNLIIAFTIFLSYPTKAQDQHVIDSLKAVIEEAKHDTSACDAYLYWGEQVYMSNPDTSLVLWRKVQELAEQNLASEPSPSLKKKFLSTLSSALSDIGYIYDDKGEINLGLQYYTRSLKIRKELGDQKGLAEALSNIGVVYLNQGNVEKALEHFFESLRINEQLDNKRGISYSLNNIANIYLNEGEIQKALEFFHKSLKLREELGDKRGIATSLNNIGGTYDTQGNHQKALEYFSKGLEVREELGDIRGTANSLNNIGGIYRNLGEFRKALRYLYRSRESYEQLGDKMGLVLTLVNIGDSYLKLSELDSAERVLLIAMDLSYEMGVPVSIKNSALMLTQLYRKQHLWKKALGKYELYIQMRDSISNEKTQKATIRQQTKYEFEKAQLLKEQEEKEVARLLAEETSRRDNLQYSVILIAILTLFGGVLALGFINVSERMAEGIIFFSFLILFEFLLVLADPYIEGWSGGAPGIKLLFNAGIAALIFPAHAFFESRLKKRSVKAKR